MAKGVEFNYSPSIIVRGVLAKDGKTVIELDAIHALWGHSGACIGVEHRTVDPSELREVTLKPFEADRAHKRYLSHLLG